MKQIQVKFRLKEILKEKNRGVLELARATKLEPATVSRIVNNRTRGVYFFVIERICAELDISPGELFEAKDVK